MRGFDSKEKEDFDRKLKNSDYGKRFKRCFILLSSSLNKNQCYKVFGNILSKGKIEIEHILPQQWAHYDTWDENNHEKYINNIGNLVPLEKKVNIKASNEFFSRKKRKYAQSKIQDVLDLSERESNQWYKEDIKEREQESIKRLKDFFDFLI